MDILRFITAGSVDDGKSTLIGRLLHDTNNLKHDILESVSTLGDDKINLAHITDGLRAERQAGITIDVAYKYFVTPNRKYIITDAPGHFRFTKNLVTGASNTDVIIILIDAIHGITAQTRMHSLVASFLNIKQVVVAINKMDLIAYDERVFNLILKEYEQIAKKLQLPKIDFIPITALDGDNISFRSNKTTWYHGDTLLEYLEKSKVKDYSNVNAKRFVTQYVVDRYHYGKLVSGSLKIGEQLSLVPSGQVFKIMNMLLGFEEANEAIAGQNICLVFDGNVKRGNILSTNIEPPRYENEFEASICWLDNIALQTSKVYCLRIHTTEVTCQIKEILYKIDNNTFENYKDDKPLTVNEFAKIKIKTESKIAFDSFENIEETGRGIIIDMETNNTSGAFTVL